MIRQETVGGFRPETRHSTRHITGQPWFVSRHAWHLAADHAGLLFTDPAGYRNLNVADGGLKRHVRSLSWELQVGAEVSAKIGFHGAAPTSPASSPSPAS